MNGQIPFGVADYFWDDAKDRQQLLHQLLDTFRSWGYGDVIPPTFEYDTTLSAQYDERLRTEMYRFLDRDGSTLSLRPEFTTQVARLVGSRLHDRPMPQRFCYGGSVFRYVSPRAGRQREFWQAGVELIGAGGPRADAEVLALTDAAMTVAGLQGFRLILGHIRYFQGLLDALALSPGETQHLQEALQRKSEPALAEFLRNTPLRTGQRQAVENLPRLAGDNVEAVLAQAARHVQNSGMHEALRNLHRITDALDGYGTLERVVIDLTELRNLGYYTGISFEAMTPGLGNSVASGGRYDDLVGKFGPPQPAVGVALGVERMLLARQRQATPAGPAPRQSRTLARTGENHQALALVQQLRSQGQTVQLEVSGRNLEDALLYAAQAGLDRVLNWQDDRFVAYEADETGGFVIVTGDSVHTQGESE